MTGRPGVSISSRVIAVAILSVLNGMDTFPSSSEVLSV